MNNPLFGPAGNPTAFYDAGHKSSFQMPKYLSDMDLDWYEYSCGKGANIRKDTAELIGNAAKECGIGMSVHAPYYMNLANAEAEKREKTRAYLYQTLGVARAMQAQRVVFHPGSIMRQKREDALQTALSEMVRIMAEMDDRGFGDIIICPETMGKINQLGSLDEVLELCKCDERLLPTIDFGHLNSRRQGAIQTQDDYAHILDTIENVIGTHRLNIMHIHFSHQEYTHMGEKRHLSFDDNTYGPYFEPLSKEIVKRKMHPIIVCESKNVMAKDALSMKKTYLQDAITADAVL